MGLALNSRFQNKNPVFLLSQVMLASLHSVKKIKIKARFTSRGLAKGGVTKRGRVEWQVVESGLKNNLASFYLLCLSMPLVWTFQDKWDNDF